MTIADQILEKFQLLPLEEQKHLLELLSKSQAIHQAKAQSDHIDSSRSNDVALDPNSAGAKLIELARSVENMPTDLPTDLAANHDHYLHGLPKRS